MQHIMHVISSLLPFPPIAWWACTIDATTITLDMAEHYEKMSYRNKYRISGANNPIQLSIPLIKGRDQRSSMKDVQLFNEGRWQVQHWRTLVSVYKQTPYWEYYEQSLQALFDTTYNTLTDFNKAALNWTLTQLKLKTKIEETYSFMAHYPAEVADLRGMKPGKEQEANGKFPHYYQIFEDRIGFLPNLSILDLLFSEGPHATAWIRDNMEALRLYS